MSAVRQAVRDRIDELSGFIELDQARLKDSENRTEEVRNRLRSAQAQYAELVEWFERPYEIAA